MSNGLGVRPAIVVRIAGRSQSVNDYLGPLLFLAGGNAASAVVRVRVGTTSIIVARRGCVHVSIVIVVTCKCEVRRSFVLM